MVIAYIIFGYALWKDKKAGMLKASIIFSLMLTIYFLLIGGIAGAVGCIIAVLRNLYFYRNEKMNKENTIWVLVIFFAIVFISTYIIYEAPNDLIICLLSLVGVFTFWYSKNKNGFTNKDIVLKSGQAFISLGYIAYAITLKSWLQIPCEMILFLAGTLGTFKRLKEFKHN